jgi:hypothetical protein
MNDQGSQNESVNINASDLNMIFSSGKAQQTFLHAAASIIKKENDGITNEEAFAVAIVMMKGLKKELMAVAAN